MTAALRRARPGAAGPERAGRAARWAPVALLAVVCYVPLLLTHRGQVGADTKTYLYLDPDRLLGRAWSMWDPNIGMGTVPHQNIGYLWPMGPWYWAFEHLGVPDWVAQRLWLGSILFGAGLGVRYLMRALGQSGPGVTAAMFLYALTPYVLTLGARISGLLLPFTALGWLVGLAVRATRERTWLHPALFGLVVATFGSVNATALVLVGLAPVLWIAFAAGVLREVRPAHALGVVARIGVMTVVTSLWWAAGLWAQGAYGIDVLRYTETARTVADASAAPEVLRGLGYWYFYGNDKLGPWIEPSEAYTQSPLLLVVTYAVPVLGLLCAAVVRWRYRAYFVGLVVAGLVLAVGAHPWDDPAPVGRGFRAFLTAQVGLAMRSLPRAVPLLALGFAVLVGVAVGALARARPRLERPAAAAVAVLAVAALPPLWTGQMVANNLQRDEDLPAHWIEAAAAIEARDRGPAGHRSRVLELPGADFASYRWGNTVDPITPGLTDRPYVARELIPYGTPLSADLVDSLDRHLQESLLEPAALAPVARLMGVGDIVVRSDLAYERYNLARPRQVHELLGMAPGVTSVAGFGGTEPNVPDPSLPLVDELELAADPDLPDPPQVAIWEVDGDPTMVRAKPASRTLLLAGDADGIIAAAAAGLLDGTELVRYSGSFAADGGGGADALREAVADGGALVVTDTNRRGGRRWGTVSDTEGATEAADEEPLVTDLGDNRLPVFEGAGPDSQTVAVRRGGVTARASAYGNGVTYTPEDRPIGAVDDDLTTGWSTSAFARAEGERLEIEYDEPRTTGAIRLLQASSPLQNRWITRVRATFDGGDAVDLELGAESREGTGQLFEVGERTFRTLTLEITGTDVGRRDTYEDLSGVGFADVRLATDDVRAEESIRPPTDLLDALGDASHDLPLALALTRWRTRPTAALRGDPEPELVRDLHLPTARRFSLSGTARVHADSDDAAIDRLLGVEGVEEATSSRHMAGDVTARASAAVDGDPTTHWSPGYLSQDGDWTRYRVAEPITFDHLDLRVVADGRHSVPTRLRLEADGGDAVEVDVPAVPDGDRRDAAVDVRVDLPRPVTGREVTITVLATREVLTIDWIAEEPIVMPVGVVEWGVPGLVAEVPSGRFDTGCRDDLLTVDGTPVAVRATGTVDDAVAGRPLELSACDDVALPAGGSRLETTARPAQGREDSALQLDAVTLRSAPGGAADPSTDPLVPAGADVEAVVTDADRWRSTIEVGPREEPTWLVIGQSHSDGWTARADGDDLGPPQPVDGHSSAFLLPPGDEPLVVQVEWRPQRVVLVALAASVVGVLAAIAVVVLGLLRRRGRPATGAGDERPLALSRRSATTSAGAAPGWPATAALALGSALVGTATVNPVAGAVLALVAVTTVRWARARPLLTLGPPALLALAAAWIVSLQVRHGLPSGFEWPERFGRVHGVAYLAVLVLALGVVVDRVRTGSWGPGAGPDDPARRDRR